MNYKGGRGVVPPAGVCPGKMIVKFRGWPRDMDMQMFPPDPSLWLGRDGVRNQPGFYVEPNVCIVRPGWTVV